MENGPFSTELIEADQLFKRFLFSLIRNLFREIRWEGIITIEVQIKWSSVLSAENNFPKLLRIVPLFEERKPTSLFHGFPKGVLTALRIGRKKHSLFYGMRMGIGEKESDKRSFPALG